LSAVRGILIVTLLAACAEGRLGSRGHQDGGGNGGTPSGDQDLGGVGGGGGGGGGGADMAVSGGGNDLSAGGTHDLASGGGGGDLSHANDLSGGGANDLSSSGNQDFSIGNRPPCLNGPGFAAFRFHYDSNSGTNAVMDAYGLPDHGGFQATPVFSTSIVDPGNGGGVEIASGNWILITYSIQGLTQIQGATFSIFGRSYDTSASGSFQAWSPIYGADNSPTDSVSNAWPYAWTSVNYSDFLHIGDDPGLVGIRVYSGPSSDDLVIHTVELCIDGT
jgi:hypothetical protein